MCHGLSLCSCSFSLLPVCNRASENGGSWVFHLHVTNLRLSRSLLTKSRDCLAELYKENLVSAEGELDTSWRPLLHWARWVPCRSIQIPLLQKWGTWLLQEHWSLMVMAVVLLSAVGARMILWHGRLLPGSRRLGALFDGAAAEISAAVDGKLRIVVLSPSGRHQLGTLRCLRGRSIKFNTEKPTHK